MPPEEEEGQKKKQGVWGKYRNLILIGGVVVVLVLIGVGIKVNSSSAESITLTSLSNQLQNVQATLINQATAIDDIPTTDSVADVSELQDSNADILAQFDSFQVEVLAQLDSIEDELASLTEDVSGVDVMGLNTTIWENHLMLMALCESLNITVPGVVPEG